MPRQSIRFVFPNSKGNLAMAKKKPAAKSRKKKQPAAQNRGPKQPAETNREKKVKKLQGVYRTPPASEKAEEPRFMFLCDGVGHEMDIDGLRGPVFARTPQAAKKYVAHVKMHQGINLVTADIQAVGYQSFQDALAQAVLTGANCYYVANPGGDVVFAIELLDSIPHEVDGWTVPLTDAELPKYIVTCEGHISMFDDGKNRGPVLAHSREVAERYIAEMEKRKGTKLSVEEGEIPVNALLDSIVEGGANCALVIRSVADDGETKSAFIFPANPGPNKE
jgi:hypothetical protein